jgi:hypothetical protein
MYGPKWHKFEVLNFDFARLWTLVAPSDKVTTYNTLLLINNVLKTLMH